VINGLRGNLEPLATFITLDWPHIGHFQSIFFVAVGANRAGITRYSARQLQVGHDALILMVIRIIRQYGKEYS
jgi:uncharacterized protein (DUF486 family)